MAKTKRIGLLFSYDEAWVAGAYYIMNLVHALKTLPVNEQPKLIFYIKNDNDHLIVTQLNYLNYDVVVLNSPLPFWKRVVNVLYRKSFNENRFLNFPNKFDLEAFWKYEMEIHKNKIEETGSTLPFLINKNESNKHSLVFSVCSKK
jgi:hypothetical protein